MSVPGVLQAPTSGWTTSADVIVVGSGVAGLTTALRVRAQGKSVLLVTKATVDEGSTRWAQGGIAAALADDDSPEDHLRDTLVAGGGLCNEEAVRILVTEGPDAVRELMAWGARFDTDPTGSISLTREGGHHRNRIAHAGGDATGAEVSRALVAAVSADPGIEVVENALVLDLLKDIDGAAIGVTLHVIGPGRRDGVGAALAPAVVLATGGFGQVFGQTTNPYVATGDGVALALRAGAAVADLEFVQFHPTVMWLGPLAQGQQPLVSEAVRGEGAVLVDNAGERFMLGEHEMEAKAPSLSRVGKTERQSAGREGDSSSDARDRCCPHVVGRTRAGRGHVGPPFSHDFGFMSPARYRSSDRPHPGCARAALRLGWCLDRSRWAFDDSGTVRLRRGGVFGCSRGQSPCIELIAGRACVRTTNRLRHRGRSAVTSRGYRGGY